MYVLYYIILLHAERCKINRMIGLYYNGLIELQWYKSEVVVDMLFLTLQYLAVEMRNWQIVSYC